MAGGGGQTEGNVSLILIKKLLRDSGATGVFSEVEIARELLERGKSVWRAKGRLMMDEGDIAAVSSLWEPQTIEGLDDIAISASAMVMAHIKKAGPISRSDLLRRFRSINAAELDRIIDQCRSMIEIDAVRTSGKPKIFYTYIGE